MTQIHHEDVAAEPPSRPGDEPWWRREPLAILELADPLHVAAHGIEGFDPARIVKRMKALNAVAAHVFPLACHLDGRTLFFQHASPGDPPPAFDYLAMWLEHSRPAGLRTIVYFNVHSVKGPYARQHPDWQQRRRDGSAKDDIYTIESTFCVNSPWRAWVFDRLRELCRYPIDGIFYDGPAFFENTCYCRHCQALFQERYGKPMPDKEDLQDPALPDLVAFQAQSLGRFLRDSRQVIRAVREGLLFYVNANPLQPQRITGRDNRVLAQHQDVLAAEGGFLHGDLMTESPIWKVGMNAKLLETQASTAGVPHLVFDSFIHTPWTYSTLPAAEAKLLWASSVAHGAATWISANQDAMDQPALDAVAPLYAFARRHRQQLFQTRSIANVALVVSQATLDYYPGVDVPHTDFTAARQADHPGNVTRELYGWYHALWSSQYPFDVLDDQALEEGRLARYAAVVLPNSACLSDACVASLRSFVAKGGTLLATLEAGCRDDRGQPRSSPMLDEVLGVRRPHPSRVMGPRQWDYLFDHARLVSAAEAQGIALCMPSPRYGLEVSAAAGARVLLSFSAPLADRYDDLPSDSGWPAVVEHPWGRGRAIYFACDWGAALHHWRMPAHLAVVRKLLERHVPALVKVQDAPPCLEVSLRQTLDGRKLLLHLVNYNGGMVRPIERVIPLRNLELSVRCQRNVQQVRALVAQTELEPAVHSGWVSFRLPVLETYEVIELMTDQDG
ncbi:MAG TPA: beta-galactosidase trimerization domain-containing protein [Phycisphaeraceae bacterium]